MEIKTLNDVIQDMSPEAQARIERGAEEFALQIEATRLNSPEVKLLVDHLQALGARVVAKFPDGSELELHISGVHTWRSSAVPNHEDSNGEGASRKT
jgi:hypothetical protein